MKFLFSSVLLFVAMGLSAAVKTDVIPGSLILTASYDQQSLLGASGATWLVTLKDDGNGPQCKAGNSGIATNVSAGKVTEISVAWGAKSNENMVVYGSHTPFLSASEAFDATEIGTLTFRANTTATLTIADDWEYVAITATAIKGKACQFASVSVTWLLDDEGGEDPQQGIVLNEICGNDGTASNGAEDWIELANTTGHDIALAGLSVMRTDEDGVQETLYTYAEGDVLQAGNYLLCRRTVHFESGIPHSRNVIVKLVSAAGKTIDVFDKRTALTDNGHHNKGGSYSRFPDMTGNWMASECCTPAEANDGTPIQPLMKMFQRVEDALELSGGMQVIVVNEAHAMAMSSAWSTTKDGTVYLLAEPVSVSDGVATADVNRVAVLTLEATGTGKWAVFFGETNNYKNEERYLACEVFKSFEFKKTVDKKGVEATITLNAAGDAEISYAAAGSVKFNYKGDGTDRFFNYDPLDKPEEHLAVHLYKPYNAIADCIGGVVSAPSSRQAYNLCGQRVSSPARGLYIVGGKKVVVE